MTTTAIIPLAAVAGIALVAAWVYLDAKAHVENGHPIVVRVGEFSVDTPSVWCVCCLVLSIFFVPLYAANRQ